MKIAKTNKTLDIGEVAQHTGLPPSTLRFYEEKGLIRSTGRHGLRRLYDHLILERLKFIALGRHAGFSLEEIGAMFTADNRFQVDRQLLSRKADDLDRNIKQLTAIRDSLRHAAKCSAPSHMECPKFQKLLRLAGKSKQKNKKTNQISSRQSR